MCISVQLSSTENFDFHRNGKEGNEGNTCTLEGMLV